MEKYQLSGRQENKESRIDMEILLDELIKLILMKMQQETALTPGELEETMKKLEEKWKTEAGEDEN
ncbi:MAG: hypothetical protein IJ806_08075 [Ruminococcus sp.]|nr:hypothetical protein [Ruminococcus sp.]